MILKCLGVCELNLQICNFAQKQQICHRNSKYAPAEKFVAIFAFAERLPTTATLLCMYFKEGYYWWLENMLNKYGLRLQTEIAKI